MAKGEALPTHEQNNIPDILKRFQNLEGEKLRAATDQSFLVDVVDIENKNYDLSINRYKEVVYEAVSYDKPEVIIGRIKALQAVMANGVLDLKGCLQ